MKNEEMRTLELTRIDMCNIQIAISGEIYRCKCQIDKAVSEDQRVDWQRVFDKWKTLKAKVVKQLNEQDVYWFEHPTMRSQM